jgi:hypothetical protein
MSTRFGMADGRCFTIYSASGLLNNYVMNKNGIEYSDNYSYRQLLQSRGPSILNDIIGSQQKINCTTCTTALVKVPNNIY